MENFETGVGKQPINILIFGYVAVVVVFVLGRVFAPTGLNAWIPFFGIWLVSIVAYLLPIALFYIANGKVERENAALHYDRKTVNLARFGLLILGLVTSVVVSFSLATELSKFLNGIG